MGSASTKVGPPPEPRSTNPRSSATTVKSAPRACSRSSSVKTISSASASMTSVRSPPPPRSPVSTQRSALVGCRSSTSRRPSAARRQAPSQSCASRSGATAIRSYPTSVPVPPGDLSSEQRAVVQGPAGPVLVLGAAGTGKTAVLVARHAWLATDGGVAPEEVLALTSTAPAADALRREVEDALHRGFAELAVHTVHGFCARLLRDEALEAGLDPFVVPVGPADRLALLLEHVDELPLRRHDLRGNPSALL